MQLRRNILDILKRNTNRRSSALIKKTSGNQRRFVFPSSIASACDLTSLFFRDPSAQMEIVQGSRPPTNELDSRSNDAHCALIYVA